MSEINAERSKVKFDLWERKLLDLSTRNSLLNLRIKGSSIPVFVPGCGNIEDLLAQDKSFSIISRGYDEEEEPEKNESNDTAAKQLPDAVKPVDTLKAEEDAGKETDTPDKAQDPSADLSQGSVPAGAAADDGSLAVTEKKPEKEPEKEPEKLKGVPAKDYSIEDLADITEFKEFIDKKYEKGVLVSSLTNAVLDKNLKTLYRGAKSSLEENGANTLFLACGFLKWYEKDRKEPCYAPVILIPVELVKKFGIKYSLRRRDEDIQFNITVSFS